ncbi:unnamed protein product [Lactuca virosa]|uniref:Uncharacterized protein n=1 Tax=Lactuca virosa TaxID=75947 RepID=A0AAU9LMB9_9ASTR|nr:unnamed protein product [Lactuca virosa]
MASSSRGGGKKGNSKRSRVVDSSVSQRDPHPPRQNSGALAFLDSQQEARSNLGVPLPEPDPDSNEDEPIPDATIPDAAAPVQQEPVMHPHHDMYMQEFRRLHEDNRRLHRDYSELYDSVCEINTEMVEFREEFYTFRDNQQAHNQHVDSLVTDMYRGDLNIGACLGWSREALGEISELSELN